MSINWDVPAGFRKTQYSIGLNDLENPRLLCLKNRDLTKRKLRPKVIDRYPPEGEDRPYYPFPVKIEEFCFPSGVTLKQEEGSPEFFSFSLTD